MTGSPKYTHTHTHTHTHDGAERNFKIPGKKCGKVGWAFTLYYTNGESETQEEMVDEMAQGPLLDKALSLKISHKNIEMFNLRGLTFGNPATHNKLNSSSFVVFLVRRL